MTTETAGPAPSVPEDVLTIPRPNLQPLPSQSFSWGRAGRLALLVFAVAVVLAPWTTTQVYAPLWQKISGLGWGGPGFAIPFILAVLVNLLLLAAVCGLYFAARETRQVLRDTLLSPNWVAKCAMQFQDYYADWIKRVWPEAREDMAEEICTAEQIRSQGSRARVAALSRVAAKARDCVASSQSTFLWATVGLLGLIAFARLAEVSLLAAVPDFGLLLLVGGWLVYGLWYFDLGLEAEAYLLNQLRDNPEPKPTSLVVGVLVLLCGIMAILVLYVPRSADAAVSAHAAAERYHQDVTARCDAAAREADGQVHPEDNARIQRQCRLLPGVPQMEAAFAGQLDDRQRADLPVAVARELQIRSSDFRADWLITVSGPWPLGAKTEYLVQPAAIPVESQ